MLKNIPPPWSIDLALGSDHFDVLTEARPLQTTPTETIAQDGSTKLEPIDHIATLANCLALIPGRLEEFTETTKNRECGATRKSCGKNRGLAQSQPQHPTPIMHPGHPVRVCRGHVCG
jgi:hypothetical protein